MAWSLLVVAFYYRRVPRLAATAFEAVDIAAIRAAVIPPVIVLVGLIAGAALVSAVQRSTTPGEPVGRRLAIWGGLAAASLAIAAFGYGPGAAALPWLGEAAERAAAAAAGAALVTAAAWFLGSVAWLAVGWGRQRARPESVPESDRAEAALFRFGLGFGAVAYVSLLLASIGQYRPAVILPLLAAIVLAGAASSLRGARRQGEQRRIARAPGWPDRLWAFLAAFAVALALAGALAPEVEYDAVWYHLWLPRLWLERGAPVDVVREYVSLYPLTWELLFGDALALGGPVAAKLLHFACLPLAAGAAWQLARRFFPAASPWLAALLVVTAPLVFWEGTTAYVDLALAFYVTLGVYALLRYREGGGSVWLVLGALTLGLGVATKHLGLVVLALVVVGLLVCRGRFPDGKATGAGEASARRAVGAVLLLVVVALVLGLPWYWRAWVASGNPVFPEMFGLFGASPPERWDAITDRSLAAFKARFGFPRTPLNLVLLPWNLTQHGAAFAGSLGPLFLASLPWLFAGRRPARDTATRWLLWIAGAYVAAWASPISSFQLRFLVPVVPLASVLAALALGRLFAALRGAPRRAASAVVAILALLNLPPFLPLHEGDRAGWNGWLAHATRQVPLPVVLGRIGEDEYLRRHVSTYAAWTHLGAAAPASAVVLRVGGGDNLYATRPLVPGDATAARGAWAGGPGGEAILMQTLARLRVTHVMLERYWMRRMAEEGAVLVSDEFRRKRLQVEFEDEQVVLYRVVPTVAKTTARSFLPSCRKASTGW